MIEDLIVKKLKYIDITKKEKKKNLKEKKFYNFLLLKKWKGKKRLMRIKVRTNNADMRVIK